MSDILPTAPSPLQYGYRTKLTPHFDAPVKRSRHKQKAAQPPEPFPEGKTVPIGFNRVGTREVIDIEVRAQHIGTDEGSQSHIGMSHSYSCDQQCTRTFAEKRPGVRFNE